MQVEAAGQMTKTSQRNFDCPETGEPCTNPDCTRARCRESEKLEAERKLEAVAKEYQKKGSDRTGEIRVEVALRWNA